MISLDEEYIGTDNASIFIHALKVCGGLLCRLSSGALIGAHFSSSVTPEEILIGCTYLRNRFSNLHPVQEAYFIANLTAWQSRNDQYGNTHKLIADIKLMLNYNGTIKVSDKNIIGLSVDVRCDTGTPVTLRYRVTPAPDPTTLVLSNNVKYVKHQTIGGVRSRTPVVIDTNTGPNRHKVPNDVVTGLAAFRPDMFIPL
jgi:hypothetical protein